MKKLIYEAVKRLKEEGLKEASSSFLKATEAYAYESISKKWPNGIDPAAELVAKWSKLGGKHFEITPKQAGALITTGAVSAVVGTATVVTDNAVDIQAFVQTVLDAGITDLSNATAPGLQVLSDIVQHQANVVTTTALEHGSMHGTLHSSHLELSTTPIDANIIESVENIVRGIGSTAEILVSVDPKLVITPAQSVQLLPDNDNNIEVEGPFSKYVKKEGEKYAISIGTEVSSTEDSTDWNNVELSQPANNASSQDEIQENSKKNHDNNHEKLQSLDESGGNNHVASKSVKKVSVEPEEVILAQCLWLYDSEADWSKNALNLDDATLDQAASKVKNHLREQYEKQCDIVDKNVAKAKKK